jgi:hypothetical protein
LLDIIRSRSTNKKTKKKRKKEEEEAAEREEQHIEILLPRSCSNLVPRN